MPTQIEKKPTDFYRCTSAAAVIDEFRSLTGRGLVDALIGDFSLPESVGILIVGSVAEGLATPSSDLDVLVLVDELPHPELPGLVTNAGHLSVESVIYIAQVELDVELVPWTNVGATLDALLTLAPVLYNPADVLSVPRLSEPECRFLHRLRTGWPIWGEPTVLRWRDELLVDLIQPCLAVRYLVEAISLIEDMESYRQARVGSAGFMARQAVEQMMLAVFALGGQTSQSTKYLLDWIAAIEIDNGGVFALGRDLLSAPLPIPGSPEESAFCEAVQDFAQNVESELCSVSEVSTAIGYIRSKRCFLDSPRETVQA